MNIRQFCAKFAEKHNKIKKHSITCSHIWHFYISALIRYTISEGLVEIQLFRHEWSSKMYENTQKKRNKIKRRFIACSYITGMSLYHVCINQLPILSEKYIFVMYFSDIGQCYQPAQKNGLENQKSGSVLGSITIICLTFSKYL